MKLVRPRRASPTVTRPGTRGKYRPDSPVGPWAVEFHCEVGVRAVKALRVAPPALRAAGGLDRAVRQPRAALIDGSSERRPHQVRASVHEPLDETHRQRYLQIILRRLLNATPPHRPVWSTRNRRPQVTVLSLLSTHSLVAHSRGDTSADHAIVAGLDCGPRLQRRIRPPDARAYTQHERRARPDLQS